MTYLNDEYRDTLVNESEDEVSEPGDNFIEEEVEEKETEAGEEDLGEEVEGEEEI